MRGVRQRGQWPPSFQRWLNNQVAGGSAQVSPLRSSNIAERREYSSLAPNFSKFLASRRRPTNKQRAFFGFQNQKIHSIIPASTPSVTKI